MSDAPGCLSSLKTLVLRRKSKVHKSSPIPEIVEDALFTQKSKQTNAFRLHTVEPDSTSSPPAYSVIGNELYRPEVLETIKTTVDQLDADLRELGMKIHDHPELAFHETYAHDQLTSFMSSRGFTVTPHYDGLSTAWRAEFTYGKGGRILGVNSEMDALPGIGHACGHNLIAMAGVGVALAAKAAMIKHGIAGKVVLLGTPAEEGGGGKIILIERGAYKDMDVCVMCHPSSGPPHSTSLGSSSALQSISVEFFGHTAHAAAAPWEGQNALDAAFLAYSAISVLRQQIKPTHRVHGIVEGKNWAPNIIPDYAKMRWMVRAPSKAEVDELRERVKACFEAAALATACKVEIKLASPHYELVQNSTLAEGFSASAKELGVETIPVGTGASTDFGNVTYQLPSLHPGFAIPTEPNGGNHTPAFTKAAGKKEAFDAAMVIIKALAHTGVRALDDDAFFKAARDSFQKGREVVQ